MTEEQIKQNADEYAKAHTPLDNWETDKALAKFAFIAGAHSHDEEIEELRKLLFEKECDIKFLEYKLRNPWISVEERLPRKLRKKNYSKEVLCRADGGTLLVSIYNYKKCEWTDGIYIKITHWMPIPELKKGE